LRCGSLRVFTDHSSDPQAARALVLVVACEAAAKQPAATTLLSRKNLVRRRRRASELDLLDIQAPAPLWFVVEAIGESLLCVFLA
jgi:hypothetical protein